MYKRYMVGPAEAIVKTFKAEVPCEEGIMKLSTISERQSAEAASLTRSLVQSLAYGATKFKNEILFHVGRLQRFADNPCDDVYKSSRCRSSSIATGTSSSEWRGRARVMTRVLWR